MAALARVVLVSSCHDQVPGVLPCLTGIPSHQLTRRSRRPRPRRATVPRRPAPPHGTATAMTRFRYAFDEARVQRFIREGRGQGTGATYRPWLQIQDVPSSGRSHRPYGIKARRVHHLLSDGEWKCFLRFEGDPSVIDICEQYPMDRVETYRVARKLGVKHPKTLDGTPYVMTLDFLVKRVTPHGTRVTPYTFKYDPELLKPREQQLMAITRGFWDLYGLELQIIDQRFFDEAFNINYDSVRAYHDLATQSVSDEVAVEQLAEELMSMVAAGGSDTLLQACRWLAGAHRTTPQAVFQVAMHLVSHGFLRVNLSSPVGLERLTLDAYAIGANRARHAHGA